MTRLPAFNRFITLRSLLIDDGRLIHTLHRPEPFAPSSDDINSIFWSPGRRYGFCHIKSQ